jgi:hypothetical protein
MCLGLKLIFKLGEVLAQFHVSLSRLLRIIALSLIFEVFAGVISYGYFKLKRSESKRRKSKRQVSINEIFTQLTRRVQCSTHFLKP